MKFLEKLISSKRIFLFLGETGSGKSEVALNLALTLKNISRKPIHFFDLDQTKPLFRSRGVKEFLIKQGVAFQSAEQLLDAPVVPHGIREVIQDEGNLCVLDLGGNAGGAVCVGQYAELLNAEHVVAYYVINSFRPFSHNKEHIQLTIQSIKSAGSIENIEWVSNPNLGFNTTWEDVMSGYQTTSNLAEEMGYNVSFLSVLKKLSENPYPHINMLFLSPYIKMP